MKDLIWQIIYEGQDLREGDALALRLGGVITRGTHVDVRGRGVEDELDRGGADALGFGVWDLGFRV